MRHSESISQYLTCNECDKRFIYTKHGCYCNAQAQLIVRYYCEIWGVYLTVCPVESISGHGYNYLQMCGLIFCPLFYFGMFLLFSEAFPFSSLPFVSTVSD